MFEGDRMILATDKGVMISSDRGASFVSHNHNHGLGAYIIQNENGTDVVSVDGTKGVIP